MRTCRIDRTIVFVERIVAPILSRLFELTLSRVGPPVPGAEQLALQVTQAQEFAIADLCEKVSIFSSTGAT